MEKVKRNLILTLLAFMLAAVSAVSLTVFSYARADEEVKENVVAEKTVKEKIEDWKKSIGEEEFSKIVAKNTPSDSVDYSAYEKITDETITNLSGIIVAVLPNLAGYNDIFNDLDFTSSNSALKFCIPGAADCVAFFDGDNNMCMIPKLTSEESAMFLCADESTWLAYYIPSTIVIDGSTVNLDEFVFDIPNNQTEVSYYAMSEIPTEPDEPDNPTPETGENENNNPPASSDKKPSVIGISGIGILIAIIGIFIFIKKRK